MIKLSELSYSTAIGGVLRLYLFHREGYHRGGQFFARAVRHPEEEIPFELAQEAAEAWIDLGWEVRITNAGDELVFHAKDKRVLYPADAEEFWEKAGR